MSDRKKRHDSIQDRERERGGGVGSAEKTLRVALAGAPVKSLGSSEMLFFFFFLSHGSAFAIWYSNAEETRGELLPDHPQNRQGLVKEHQLGQQDAGPAHVQGDVRQLTHTGAGLVLPVLLFTRVNCVCVSLFYTHIHTTLAHRGWPVFPVFDSHPKKQFQNSSWFFYFRASEYGLSIRYEDRRREM